MKNQRQIMNVEITGKGFTTRRLSGLDANGNTTLDTKIMETLYWVHPTSGNVWKAQEKRVSHNFHVPGMVWELVEALPEVREFIGNYHGPIGCN